MSVKQTGNPLRINDTAQTKLVIDKNYQKFKHNLFNSSSTAKQPIAEMTRIVENLHKETPNVPKPFPCLLCEKSFLQKKELDRHIVDMHESALYKCQICGKRYKDKNVFKHHVNKHNNVFKCKQCGKILSDGYQLRYHLFTHQKVRPHKCQWCDKSFAHANGKKYHLRTNHLEEQGLAET